MLQLEDSDSDICGEEELDLLFKAKCSLLLANTVAPDKTVILHVTGTAEANCNVAIGASSGLCEVYNFSNHQLTKIDTLSDHSGGVVGVCFSQDNNNLLYSASARGYINLWDLRIASKLVTQFKDTTVENTGTGRPLQCFDVSSNNRLLAAGTELCEGEAFVLFWDVRNIKLLGGYWESHTDDITQIKFNPDNSNLLSSGSTDGLINIYDLGQPTEEDALSNTLNTESSVEQILWCKYKKKDCISGITHTSDIQLWKSDGAEPFAHFRRENIGNAIKRKSSAHCYIAAAHSYDFDKLFVLAASNWNNGECLRALDVNAKELSPLFLLKENKQRVRCSRYIEHHNMLITGGENGILNFWNIDIN